MNFAKLLPIKLCIPAVVIVVSAIASPSTTQAAGEDHLWDQRPYQVEVQVAFVGGPAAKTTFATELENRIEQSLAHRIGRFWKTTVVQVAASDLAKHCQMVEGFSQEVPASKDPIAESSPDKIFLLLAEYQNGEMRIIAREYDTVLGLWGQSSQPIECQPEFASGAMVHALFEVFRPVAMFEVDTETDRQVKLKYRGITLTEEKSLASASMGGILTPYRVRYSRSGEGDSETRVRWTHLVANSEPEDDSADESTATVHSHARLPFGSRRRGRVGQLAIVSRAEAAPTPIRLYDLNDESKPLIGYELLIGEVGSSNPQSVGRTDANGTVIAPASDHVMMAHIKCGSLVVASLPIAPGVDQRLDLPLLDESQRLKAELKIGALREELIDLVARRSIYAARIRRLLGQDRVEEAERLVRELETLPGRAQFNQKLKTTEQALRADHPIVQKRIDQLISETQTVLGASLDARQIRDLATEVLRAQRAADQPDLNDSAAAGK